MLTLFMIKMIVSLTYQWMYNTDTLYQYITFFLFSTNFFLNMILTMILNMILHILLTYKKNNNIKCLN